MDNDPTMALIRSMDDPSKWQRTTVVAFLPHHVTHPARQLADGTSVPAQTIEVSESQLQSEVDRANLRAARTGRLDPVTIGHRNFDPGFPETKQPPLVGFARNYRVQRMARPEGSLLAIVYDEYAAKDKVAQYDLYRQFPFRSAEYSPAVGLAGVAALLRPPALNMGTTYLYEASMPIDHHVQYQAALQELREKANGTWTPPQHSEAVRYMRARPGCSYEDAEAAVLAGKR